jgi:protein-S-isoprenylcysteine O-methyltransferase Ste14
MVVLAIVKFVRYAVMHYIPIFCLLIDIVALMSDDYSLLSFMTGLAVKQNTVVAATVCYILFFIMNHQHIDLTIALLFNSVETSFLVMMFSLASQALYWIEVSYPKYIYPREQENIHQTRRGCQNKLIKEAPKLRLIYLNLFII